MHDLCKACVDYMKFGLVYYLIPNQGLERGFQRLENDWDVLDMCNIGFVDVAKDVHVHFKHVVNEMLEIILADVLENVIGEKMMRLIVRILLRMYMKVLVLILKKK